VSAAADDDALTAGTTARDASVAAEPDGRDAASSVATEAVCALG
jgi:hypothetical protein